MILHTTTHGELDVSVTANVTGCRITRLELDATDVRRLATLTPEQLKDWLTSHIQTRFAPS